MPEISKDVVALLQYLAPGFLVAWIYFGMTAHEKPSQFERLVQALIYTVVVQALVMLERLMALGLGKWRALGSWSAQSDLVAGLVTATILGFLLAAIVDRDMFHTALRRLGITTRTAHPSEWHNVLSEYSQFIQLELKDESRIYGWPSIWPSNPEKGHFLITNATWTKSGTGSDLANIDGLLVNVTDVAYVVIRTPKENPNDKGTA